LWRVVSSLVIELNGDELELMLGAKRSYDDVGAYVSPKRIDNRE